jgi:hypothetical protein
MVGGGGEVALCRGGQKTAMDLLIKSLYEHHFRTDRRNEEGRNRCLREYFACSENSIMDFLYIVVEDADKYCV